MHHIDAFKHPSVGLNQLASELQALAQIFGLVWCNAHARVVGACTETALWRSSVAHQNSYTMAILIHTKIKKIAAIALLIKFSDIFPPETIAALAFAAPIF